ncbi:MAG TPA: cytochrome c oxidase subunit 3 [Planctomycetaceae bacterium]|nr:cytochrome c oxidase subunit 3 [Planctomycetaceae bacterium]
MSTIGHYTPSQVAVRFFVAAILAFSTSAFVALLLVDVHRDVWSRGSLAVPPAFVVSSLLLFGGSAALGRALGAVRIERQRTFRRGLVAALVIGAVFVGVQSYGLRCLLENQQVHTQAATGEHAFAFVLTALHGLHVTVALLFLAFVTVRALGDRYDHEYYWGVTVCAWFWHVLGIVWVGVLAVFAIAL